MRPARQPPTLLVPGVLALSAFRRGDRREWAELVHRNRDWLARFEVVAPPAAGPQPARSHERGRGVSWADVVREQERRTRSGEALSWVLRRPPVGDATNAPERWRPVGQLSISGIVRGASQTGTLGYWIDHEEAGHGLMGTAVGLAVRHAFGPAGLHRLEAVIHPANAASLALAHRAGFTEEGVRRRALHLASGWTDHLVLALLREDLEHATGPSTGPIVG